jgi:hypothetical protein
MSERAHAEPGKASSTSVPQRDERAQRRADPLARSGPATIDLLQRAASETARPLDSAVRAPLEARLGHDFSRVRVRAGPASSAAAERIGARAYTLGTDIHLGAEAESLAGSARTRLLAHETVHTAQQGGVTAAPHASLRVSDPNDATETEAHKLAGLLEAPPAASRSLALRDRMRPHSIARLAAPQVQRDLTGKHPVREGEFNLNLKTESHPGAKCGMSGTIKFKAAETAPDSTSIRLLQVARVEDLTTGKDYSWSGDEANRNKVMTTAAPGVQPGFFVDVVHKNRNPRTAKGDAPVSPYYIDDYLSLGSPNNKDGSKKGKTINEASLWDYPGWSSKSRFSFETVAKASDTNHVYGTVMWGFEISDPAKGTVDKERAVGRNVTLLTTDKAIEKFNEFYKNPGASTAP